MLDVRRMILRSLRRKTYAQRGPNNDQEVDLLPVLQQSSIKLVRKHLPASPNISLPPSISSRSQLTQRTQCPA